MKKLILLSTFLFLSFFSKAETTNPMILENGCIYVSIDITVTILGNTYTYHDCGLICAHDIWDPRIGQFPQPGDVTDAELDLSQSSHLAKLLSAGSFSFGTDQEFQLSDNGTTYIFKIKAGTYSIMPDGMVHIDRIECVR